MVIQGRDTLEAIKTKVGSHVCLRKKSMDKKKQKQIYYYVENIYGRALD